MHHHLADAIQQTLDAAQALQCLMDSTHQMHGGNARPEPFEVHNTLRVLARSSVLSDGEGPGMRARQERPQGVFSLDTTASAHAQIAFQHGVERWKAESPLLAQRLREAVDSFLLALLPEGSGHQGPTQTIACTATITAKHAAIGLCWAPGNAHDTFNRRLINLPLTKAHRAWPAAVETIQRLAATPLDPAWPFYEIQIDGVVGRFKLQAANPAMAVLSVAARGVNTLFVPTNTASP